MNGTRMGRPEGRFPPTKQERELQGKRLAGRFPSGLLCLTSLRLQQQAAASADLCKLPMLF